MTVYDDLYNLRCSSAIKVKTTVGMAKAALDIFDEDPATSNHAARVAWAQEAISNPEGKADELIWGVISDATVRTNGEASTDAQIQSAVDAAIVNLVG